MDVAATGFALPLIGPLQDRPQTRPNPASRGVAEAAGNRNNASLDDTGVSRNERVVPGEVIYSRPNDGRIQSRSESADNAPSFSFNGSRRFSLQAALQTFQDNEALVARPGQNRQVSGIIDEYV